MGQGGVKTSAPELHDGQGGQRSRDEGTWRGGAGEETEDRVTNQTDVHTKQGLKTPSVRTFTHTVSSSSSFLGWLKKKKHSCALQPPSGEDRKRSPDTLHQHVDCAPIWHKYQT